MTQYFNIKFLYTPFINYNVDYEQQTLGSFEKDLVDQQLDYSHSHLYTKEIHFAEKISFDYKGTELAKEYAWTFNILRSMTFERGHFEFLIGSVTLDSYQIIETGIIYIIDCTHGYHKTSVHLVSRFPQINKDGNNPISIFPYQVWFAVLFTLSLLTFCTLNIIYVYAKFQPQLLRSNLEISQVVIRLILGMTEPDFVSWFKGNRHSSGRIIILVHSIASFFFLSLYNVDLRSKIIVPEMQKSIDSLSDIDFRSTKVLLHFDEGTKLTLSDQSQLYNLVPLNVGIKAKTVKVSK